MSHHSCGSLFCFLFFFCFPILPKAEHPLTFKHGISTSFLNGPVGNEQLKENVPQKFKLSPMIFNAEISVQREQDGTGIPLDIRKN